MGKRGVRYIGIDPKIGTNTIKNFKTPHSIIALL